MDWVTGLVPGGRENFNACLIMGDRLSKSDHERYTHDCVTLLPAVQLAYNTRWHFTTGKSPSLVGKGWNPLLPVDHLKENLLNIHPTAKGLPDIWKRSCDRAFKFIAGEKEYNKQRWDKSHMEPEFKKRDQSLVSTLRFNNLKGPKKMRDAFLGPLNIIKLIGEMQWRSNSQRKFLGNTQYS
ncbi:hypothetical protein O181_001850 [Austropuccinia psidii MF-1]|uniref:Uncharacterized protein n=1 Tax=Austropuccinia psidii MF-1 TaxID=1389203 RepID=A0A9Q3BBW7_9BASI|nr:hypothetical protein [Austropuccinia psidii MF-1]